MHLEEEDDPFNAQRNRGKAEQEREKSEEDEQKREKSTKKENTSNRIEGKLKIAKSFNTKRDKMGELPIG